MLQKLIITNYAIIDNLLFEPDGGLNTITGETGAGKSIILGAFSLILGERADTSVLINKNEKSVVEAYFNVTYNNVFKKALEDAELDYEPQCIIRREIAVNGKSRAFVNDTPVTLSVLNKLVTLLVDLHRQFGHLAFEEDNFALDILDAITNDEKTVSIYKTLYIRYKKIVQQLVENREKRAQWQKESDYKQFLLEELLQADFKENELENIEQKVKQISNAERIKNILCSSKEALEAGEMPIVNELKLITKQISGILDVMPSLKPLHERISSTWAELKDIADELSNEESKLISDPQLLASLQQRMDIGYKLLKKHSINTTNELIEIKERLEEELKATLNLNEAIDQLAKEETQIYNELIIAGKQLSKLRLATIPVFTEKMNHLLTLVGMPNASFKVQSDVVAPQISGLDDVQFLFDANKTGIFQLLQKSASGGEMSRIMLCIKSLTANAKHLPTIIFDEVDAGISGEAARQVAILLRNLSKNHQIICITHQPQVAAKGTRHYYVYKEADTKGRLTTKIKILQPEERIFAIAQMIGGEQPSQAAISNAKELIGH